MIARLSSWQGPPPPPPPPPSSMLLRWRAGALFCGEQAQSSGLASTLKRGGRRGWGAWSPPHLPDVTEGQTGANYARYDYFVRRPSWTTRGVYPPGALWTADATAEDCARLSRSTTEEGGGRGPRRAGDCMRTGPYNAGATIFCRPTVLPCAPFPLLSWVCFWADMGADR